MKHFSAALGVAVILVAPVYRAFAADTTVPVKTPADSSSIAAPLNSPRAVWHLTADPVHRMKTQGVPNFGKLNDQIWRSGQPTKEGYQELAKQGLKTVVNLREEYPQDKDLIPEGTRYVFIPIKDEHEPTAEQAKQFMEVASNPDNWPLLVHCHAGEGRAGVMSALVRLSLDGWDVTKTMHEVGNFRGKALGFISMSMPSGQQSFIKHWGETAAVAKQQ